MSYDGSGNYNRIHNWTQDAANSLNINAGEMDAEDNSIAGAFNLCLTRDGQAKMTTDFLPSADASYNVGSGSKRWLSITAVGALFGSPVTGPTITVNSATNWHAATFSSTVQLTGPNKLINANQNVSITQLMLHGLNAEIVSVAGTAPVDQKVWSFYADPAGTYNWRIENDALSATFTFMQVVRTGAFTGDQPSTIFSNGHGAVTFNTTSLNGYQATINAGTVPGFANGLNIIAGSIGADNALLIQNQGQTATFLQMTGQGATTLGPCTSIGLITLTVKGFASSSSPAATFGGAASNFITVTDGAGIVLQAATSTGLAATLVGATSNHALLLTTNNAAQLSISNSGAITFNNVVSTSTSPVAGGAGALPATPAGYFALTIGATARRIPFYT